MIVESFFRLTHNITGIAVLLDGVPLTITVHDGTNDAATFHECLLCSIQKGFLVRGDVLVLDNAAVHQYKDNYYLQEYLYTECGILLLFLPTRSPELNPIELLWNTLVQILKQVPILYTKSECRRDAAPLAACAIMENFTF